jgi:hypothetical protein
MTAALLSQQIDLFLETAKTEIEEHRRWRRSMRHHQPSWKPPWTKTRRIKTGHRLVAVAALLAHQAHNNTDSAPRIGAMDVDSRPLGIDNRASAFISTDIDDFDGPLTDTNQSIKAFGGNRSPKIKIGTAKFRFEDDSGRLHTFKLPASYFVPGGGDERLFSPQHWAQCLRKSGSKNVSCTTYHHAVTLKWDGFCRTVELDLRSNVATLYTSPGYSKFHAFCATAGFNEKAEESNPLSMEATADFEDEPANVTDDEDDYDNVSDDDDDDFESAVNSVPHSATEEQLPNTVPSPAQETSVVEEENTVQLDTAAAQLLYYHHRYNHAPFSKLQEMAKQRTIPSVPLACTERQQSDNGDRSNQPPTSQQSPTSLRSQDKSFRSTNWSPIRQASSLS